ncbi:hypothetical protein ACHWQZ_G005269 [Mnemiopsis leidyi]
MANMEQLSVLTAKIMSDVSYTNEIATILDMLSEEKNSEILTVAVLSSLRKIYEKLQTNRWLFEEGDNAEDKEVFEYRQWMRETYNDVFTAITSLITSPHQQVQHSAFSISLFFLTAETVFLKLPRERTFLFVEQVLLSKNTDLVMKLSKEVSDLDWKFAALKAVGRFSKLHSGDHTLSDFVYQLLSAIDISELSQHSGEKQKTDASKTIHHICKAYNSTWVLFLKMPKSRELYHTILSSLHENVIPHMHNPKLLIDFLVDSYNLGGTASLLALNSLFILITKYNLDYPSFYPKLYRMLTPDLLHTTYVARFIMMLDIFLKSPLLPAYLVAAFAKRLAHNALQAPPHVVIIVMRFITNLVKLHPSVKRLVHRGKDHAAVRADPFLYAEEDPAQCNALQSSLWELEVLAEHYCPAVPAVVKTLRKPTDEILVGLGLEKDYDGLFREYLKMWNKDPPLEFEEPVSFDQSEYSDIFSFN